MRKTHHVVYYEQFILIDPSQRQLYILLPLGKKKILEQQFKLMYPVLFTQSLDDYVNWFNKGVTFQTHLRRLKVLKIYATELTEMDCNAKMTKKWRTRYFYQIREWVIDAMLKTIYFQYEHNIP